MKQIKNLFFSFLALLIIFPVLVSAQDMVIPNAEVVMPDTPQPKGTIVGILQNFMQWLLIIVGLLGVIGFVISGIIYLTSAGNEEQAQRGKRTMVYSIVGIIVAMLGVIVMQAAKALLSGNTSNF